jgi:hypothetical protein
VDLLSSDPNHKKFGRVALGVAALSSLYAIIIYAYARTRGPHPPDRNKAITILRNALAIWFRFFPIAMAIVCAMSTCAALLADILALSLTAGFIMLAFGMWCAFMVFLSHVEMGVTVLRPHSDAEVFAV